MSFCIRPLFVKNVLRIEADSRADPSIHRQVMDLLTHDMTWAIDESKGAYMFGVPGFLREESGMNHYLLFVDGNWAKFSTKNSFSNEVAIVYTSRESTLAKDKLWDIFTEALAVYGRWGKGADGMYCTRGEQWDGAFVPVRVDKSLICKAL